MGLLDGAKGGGMRVQYSDEIPVRLKKRTKKLDWKETDPEKIKACGERDLCSACGQSLRTRSGGWQPTSFIGGVWASCISREFLTGALHRECADYVLSDPDYPGMIGRVESMGYHYNPKTYSFTPTGIRYIHIIKAGNDDEVPPIGEVMIYLSELRASIEQVIMSRGSEDMNPELQSLESKFTTRIMMLNKLMTNLAIMRPDLKV